MAVGYQVTPPVVSGTSRKNGYDTIGDVSGAVAINIGAGSFDNKKYTLIGDVTISSITGTATSSGTVYLSFTQDATGFKQITSWPGNVIWNQGSQQHPYAQPLAETIFEGIWDGTNLTI